LAYKAAPVILGGTLYARTMAKTPHVGDIIRVNDRMQKRYLYVIEARPGRDFAPGPDPHGSFQWYVAHAGVRHCCNSRTTPSSDTKRGSRFP
jgi:hypothetical protein